MATPPRSLRVLQAKPSRSHSLALTRTVHPPAGSNPVIMFLMKPAWDFALFPTLAGALILVLVALIFHNLTREGRWPKYW